MEDLPIDPAEMAKRHDEDFHAVMNMIGEGSPIFESYTYRIEDLFERKGHIWTDDQDLPETYQ